MRRRNGKEDLKSKGDTSKVRARRLWDNWEERGGCWNKERRVNVKRTHTYVFTLVYFSQNRRRLTTMLQYF